MNSRTKKWTAIHKSKKIFSPRGLILIFLLLLLGIIFVGIERSHKIDIYFEKKYPQVPQRKIVYKNYRIGFVTDAHARFSKNCNDIIPKSKKPMVHFVSKMNNEFKPDVVIDGGDFIDGTKRFGQQSINDFLKFEKIFKKLTMPSYHVFGNHELRGMTRETWIDLNSYKKTYYYFDTDRLRIIVLDSTLIPNFDEINSLKDAAFNKQLDWLNALLEKSSGFRTVIFIHHPPLKKLNPKLSAEKLASLTDLFSKFGVRAVFSGHVEIPYYENKNGVDYFVVPGFFRSEAKGVIFYNSFAEVTLGIKNGIKVFYTRENDNEYKSFFMPSEEYNNIENEIKEKVKFFNLTDD